MARGTDHADGGCQSARSDDVSHDDGLRDIAELPREQAIEALVARTRRYAAYQRKWWSEGMSAKGVAGEPMRSTVLNDEEFEAYWCRRELIARSAPGFVLVRYHDEPRFDAVSEADLLQEFAKGGTDATLGVDVLVMNREVNVGRTPAAILTTARGRRIIYRK